MKIVAISDIHGYIPESIPECDVLCISGDIVPLEVQRGIEKSSNWLMNIFHPKLSEMPCKHVVMTWGNHDFIGCVLYKAGHSGEEQTEMLFGVDSKCHILIDESVDIEGVKFYGTPWIPELSGWAFYNTSENLKETFEKIPEDIDVLLTHCPPKIGTQGVVLQKCWNHMRDFGCTELYNALCSKKFEKPLYVLSGHIHTGNHKIEEYDGIKYVNVSLKDEEYMVSYEPTIIEI
jgi:Icc-related predicted phosphoesterase